MKLTYFCDRLMVSCMTFMSIFWIYSCADFTKVRCPDSAVSLWTLQSHSWSTTTSCISSTKSGRHNMASARGPHEVWDWSTEFFIGSANIRPFPTGSHLLIVAVEKWAQLIVFNCSFCKSKLIVCPCLVHLIYSCPRKVLVFLWIF